MPPVLVHGVDISALEGWMIKINNNPSVFGKNTSRRWFRVSFVPAGSDQKLIISYSTNKTSKEPRGWLYIEDVSGVYARRDMIEVVSPARTLRFKGETTVEHRLWSDSLHKLCNPPKPASAKAIEEEKKMQAESVKDKEHTAKLDRERIAEPKKSREHAEAQRDATTGRASEAASTRLDESKMESRREQRSPVAAPARHEPTPEKRTNGRGKRYDSEEEQYSESSDDGRRGRRDRDRGHHQFRKDNNSEVDAESSASEHEEEPPRRHQALERTREAPTTSAEPSRRSEVSSHSDSPPQRRRDEEHRPTPRKSAQEGGDDGDSDEEEEPRNAKKPAQMERRPSLLVASIKSMSPCAAAAAGSKGATPTTQHKDSKAINSDSDDEDEDVDEDRREDMTHNMQKVKVAAGEDDEEESPQEVTPRDEEPRKHPRVAEDQHRDVDEEPTPKSKSKPKNDDYFDSEDEDDSDEPANNKRRPSFPASPAPMTKAAPTSQVRADNNFVDDDWDAEDPNDSPPSHKRPIPNASPEKRTSVGFGGVAADANFATEDWD